MKTDTTFDNVIPMLARTSIQRDRDRMERQRKVSDRLEYLSTVEDGWFEGRGVAPDKAGLLWLTQKLADYYTVADLPLPDLYPTEAGGVIGEWSLERHVCGIEIDLEARTGSWFDVDRETHEGIDERVLDLDSADGWQWLVDRLATMTATSQL